MDSSPLDSIHDSGKYVHVSYLSATCTFLMVSNHADGTPSKLFCTKFASVDTDLNIRQGSTLLVLSLRCLLTTQHIG